jgi:hypothetical protein
MNEGQVRSFIFESYKKGRSVNFVRVFLQRNGVNVNDWNDYIDSYYIRDKARKRARIIAAGIIVAGILLSLTYEPVYLKADLNFDSTADFIHFNEMYLKPSLAGSMVVLGLVVMALGRYLTNVWLSALLLIWACASILLSFFNSNIPGMVAATLVVPLLILITQKEEKVKHPRQLNTSGQ